MINSFLLGLLGGLMGGALCLALHGLTTSIIDYTKEKRFNEYLEFLEFKKKKNER